MMSSVIQSGSSWARIKYKAVQVTVDRDLKRERINFCCCKLSSGFGPLFDKKHIPQAYMVLTGFVKSEFFKLFQTGGWINQIFLRPQQNKLHRKPSRARWGRWKRSSAGSKIGGTRVCGLKRSLGLSGSEGWTLNREGTFHSDAVPRPLTPAALFPELLSTDTRGTKQQRVHLAWRSTSLPFEHARKLLPWPLARNSSL